MSYGQGDLTPGGFGGSSDQSYQNDVPRNDFPRLTRVVSSNIQKIQQNANDISRMVEQLGTDTDSSDLRDRLSQRIHYTNQLAKDTARFLRNIKDIPPPYPASEQRHRKTQVERLTTDFSDILNRFQTIQRDAASKEKETLARVRAASASQDPSGGGALVDITGGMQTQEQAQVSQQEIEEIEERQAAIQQLESDIIDVNEIFRDLATMVKDQGEVIDSIADNVDDAGGNVTSGNQQLFQARNSASSLRKKKVICAVLVLVLIAVLVLIIYFSVPKSGS